MAERAREFNWSASRKISGSHEKFLPVWTAPAKRSGDGAFSPFSKRPRASLASAVQKQTAPAPLSRAPQFFLASANIFPQDSFARMKAKIIVTPKKAVVDPQGKTVQGALEQMGYRGIKAV